MVVEAFLVEERQVPRIKSALHSHFVCRLELCLAIAGLLVTRVALEIWAWAAFESRLASRARPFPFFESPAAVDVALAPFSPSIPRWAPLTHRARPLVVRITAFWFVFARA